MNLKRETEYNQEVENTAKWCCVKEIELCAGEALGIFGNKHNFNLAIKKKKKALIKIKLFLNSQCSSSSFFWEQRCNCVRKAEITLVCKLCHGFHFPRGSSRKVSATIC